MIKIAFLLFIPLLAFAESPLPNRLLSSARCLAMGDNCLANSNDTFALFYNPAKLARIKFQLSLIDAAVDGNHSGIKMAKEKKDNPSSLSDKEQLLLETRGHTLSARGQAFSGFVIPNFGLGAYASMSQSLNSLPDKVVVQKRQDAGAIGGFGISFWKGIIKIGYSGSYLMRSEMDKDFLLTQGGQLSSELNEGVGFSHNAGISVTLPIRLLPSLNFVARDIGWTVFEKRGGFWTRNTPAAPKARKPSYDSELAFMVKLGRKSKLNLMGSYRDITNSYDESASYRLGGGLEFDIYDAFFLRGGVMEKYPSFGMGFKAFGNKLDLTSFATKGPSQGQDRRYMLQLSLGF